MAASVAVLSKRARKWLMRAFLRFGRVVTSLRRCGHCGDWVWYVRGNRQFRRLYLKPQDPRTPRQLHERARFGAASQKYSHSLTQEQREARIAAGAKFRSRPRLAQSGPLTGQQYSIRVEYAANAAERLQRAARAAKVLQTQGILLSTSDIHRSITGVSPEHHRRNTGQASRKEGRRKNGECGRHKEGAAWEVLPGQRLARSRWAHCRNTTRPVRWQAARNPGTFPVSGRGNDRASPTIS